MGCFPPDDGTFVLYCSEEELSEKVWANEFAISGTVLELRPGMPGISPALVTLVHSTATAEAIPAGDTVYPRLCEIVSDNDGKYYTGDLLS